MCKTSMVLWPQTPHAAEDGIELLFVKCWNDGHEVLYPGRGGLAMLLRGLQAGQALR